MFAAFVVLLREGFEASLLVAIVLAYLTQIDHHKQRWQVWHGVGAAILLSLVLAGVLFATAGELRGPAEKLFEACALFLAVGFLTYMVLWMRRESRALAGNIRRDVNSAVGRGGGLALALLVFVMVLREGIASRDPSEAEAQEEMQEQAAFFAIEGSPERDPPARPSALRLLRPDRLESGRGPGTDARVVRGGREDVRQATGRGRERRRLRTARRHR